MVCFERKTFRHVRVDGLADNAELGAVDVAFCFELYIYFARDVTGNSEADSFAAAGLSKDQGVDTNHVPIGIEQWTAAIAWVDGRVGLNIDHRIVAFDLPRNGADNAHADGIIQSERIAQCEDDLALFEFVGICEVQERQIVFSIFTNAKSLSRSMPTTLPSIGRFSERSPCWRASLSMRILS